MEIRKVETYCDRCFKKLKNDKEWYCTYDRNYRYILCEECKTQYDEYKKEIEKLENKWEKITKKYNFGEYLLEKLNKKEEELNGDDDYE